MSNLYNKYDISLFIIICLVGVCWFLGISVFNENDVNSVVVTVDGELYSEYKLASDERIVIATEYGENTFEIKDNKVKMLEATCKDQYCVHQKEIKTGNDTIVCLPNRLVIELSQKNNEVDTIIG